MPDNVFPIYQIQDFVMPKPAAGGFYLDRFEKHLKSHAFIQKPHKHDFYILLFITAGSGTHTIDFKAYPVQPGAVFFLSPGQVHSWELSPEAAGFILFFYPEFYQAGKASGTMFRFSFFNVLNQNPMLQLTATETQYFGNYLLEMENEYVQQHWKKETILQNCLENLLIRFARKFQEKAGSLPDTHARLPIMQQLEDLIEAAFKTHQPVSYFADKLNLTVKQLNEITQNALGRTTTELIKARLVLEARRLLTHSDLTISQVAATLGFFDNSYFSRFFKKNSGQTPEQFRQSL